MANHNLPRILFVEVHRTTEAVLEHIAVGALTRFHPLTVAEGLETVFPDIQEVVLINVALDKSTVDVRTSRNGAVNKHRADGDTRAAEIEPVANLALIGTNICLATELAIHPSLLSGRDNKVH